MRGRFLCSRPKRGESTGKNPTDRGKTGTKRHLLTDKNGIPLTVKITGANVYETTVFAQMIDALPTVAKKRGRPRWKPKKVHADKGYGSQANRDHLKAAGIVPHIACRGRESSQKLVKYRWVIERTFAWLNRFRRLRIRYERRDDIHKAFLLLGCALIWWNFLSK